MDASADAKPIRSSVSPELIEAFVAATITAFQELADTVVEAREPLAVQHFLIRDVNASVVLRHDPPGHLMLSFPRPVLEALTGRYVAGLEPLTSDLVDDAAGEFANVIAGQAKTMLKGTPEHFWLSTPIVSRSAPAAVNDEPNNIVAVIFACDAGTFALQIVHW